MNLYSASHNGWPGCRWCHGRGCVACVGEERKAMESNLANPLVIHQGNAEEMAILVKHFGRETVDAAYESGEVAIGDLLMSLHFAEAKMELAELAHAQGDRAISGDEAAPDEVSSAAPE